MSLNSHAHASVEMLASQMSHIDVLNTILSKHGALVKDLLESDFNLAFKNVEDLILAMDMFLDGISVTELQGDKRETAKAMNLLESWAPRFPKMLHDVKTSIQKLMNDHSTYVTEDDQSTLSSHATSSYASSVASSVDDDTEIEYASKLALESILQEERELMHDSSVSRNDVEKLLKSVALFTKHIDYLKTLVAASHDFVEKEYEKTLHDLADKVGILANKMTELGMIVRNPQVLSEAKGKIQEIEALLRPLSESEIESNVQYGGYATLQSFDI